jgi:chaperonin GroES
MKVSNDSGITPLEYFVLIKPDEVEQKTKGGIFLPDQTLERNNLAQMTGILMAFGPLAFKYEDFENPLIPQIGQRVAFGRYSGVSLKGQDGIEYRLLKDGDLTAIVAHADATIT